MNEPSALEQYFGHASAAEADIDLGHLKRMLPTARDAQNAHITDLHTRADWNDRHYLLEFFHDNQGMLTRSKRILQHLIKTHSSIVSLQQLDVDKLMHDDAIRDACASRSLSEHQIDARITTIREAYVTAGFLIPEIKHIFSHRPYDALQLGMEASQWAADAHKHARPLRQLITRYLVVKLLREGDAGVA